MIRIKCTLKTAFVFMTALFMLAVTSPALAITTGSIRGTVVDQEEGLPIPEVLITLSSDNLIGGAQERIADANGDFMFVGLLPGIYDLTAVKGGFQTMTYGGIVVQVNRQATPEIEMPIEGTTDEIYVEQKRQVVDVSNTTRGEVLTKEFLQRIPTGRTYQSAIQSVAGVGPGTGGNANMGGAATNENTYMLDGATITDPVTGTFSLNFNYDAIQQIEVLLGGFMPEYGRSLGGIVNIVTDSGTNNLEFNGNVFYENSNWAPRMDARYSSDGSLVAPTGFDASTTGVTVSSLLKGPLIRDRAWFLLSYQYSRSLRRDVGISLPRDYDAHYVYAKLTAQPNAEHRFTASLQIDPTVIDNLDQDDPYVKPEAQGRQAQGGYVSNIRWQWFLSPDANVDTQVVIQKSWLERGSVPCTHDDSGYNRCAPGELEGTVDWQQPARIGAFGAYNSGNYSRYDFDDRLRYAASTKISILSIDDPFGGTHDVKAGVDIEQVVWDRTTGIPGNILYVDINEDQFDPGSFKNYYWQEMSGPFSFVTTMRNWSAFIQDEWKPIKNVTIKGGVRYDSSVAANEYGEPTINASRLVPRVYAAWDPFGNKKTKISGGYGRFTSTSTLGIANFTGAQSYGSKLYYGEFLRGTDPDQGFQNKQSLIYDFSPIENDNTTADKMVLPRSDELLFMFKQEIVEDLAVGVTLTAKYTRNLYEPDDRNIIYDEDGSNFIGTRYGDSSIGAGRLRTPNLALRDYYQADVYFDKQFAKRWFARVTYTYTQSVGTSSTSESGSFYNDPQTQYNYGPLNTDYNHVVKAYGSWELPTDPWQQTIGFNFTYRSGGPLERRYYSETYGRWGVLRIDQRGVYYNRPDFWSLNLQFSQEFDVRKGKLVAVVMLENVTNNRAVDSINANFYTSNRLHAVSRQAPFGVQLGLRYEF